MAIASFNRRKRKPKIVERVEEEKYDVAIKDTREDLPVLNFISGKKWVINYFNQYRSENVMGSQGLGGPSFITQFTKIVDLTVYTDDGVSGDNPDELTASVTVNAGFIPILGDYVHTKVGSREALFKVVKVEKAYHDGGEIFLLDLNIDSFIDQDDTGYKLLTSKVVNTLYYDDTYVFSGGKPLLRERDRERKIDLATITRQIVTRYLSTFLKNDILILNDTIIDKNLSNFFIAIVDGSIDTRINTIELVGQPSIKDDNIYFYLINRTTTGLTNCKMFLKYQEEGLGLHNLSIYKYLGVNKFLDTDYTQDITIPLESSENDAERLIPKVPTEDGCYLFTNNFYNGVDNLTKIEKLIKNYLYKKDIEEEELRVLINDFTNWSNEEFYFLGPILIFLITSFLKGE